MRIWEKGILEGSEIHIHTPSEQARRLFFYPLCAGHYYCNGEYRVCRSNFDSFQVLYVAKGKGYCEHNGRMLPVQAGSMIFLDCYRPHAYGTDSAWETYWLHFDGQLARAYFELCGAGPVYPPDKSAEAARHLRKICQDLESRKPLNEAMLSRQLVDLLTELMLCGTAEQGNSRNAAMVEDVVSYMREHLDEPLAVADLAARVSVSPYYFIRLFKAETGMTPHRYLIRMRVDLARYLLKTTELPLKEIAWRGGFGSASNLCTVFHTETGMTPQAYRIENGG